MARLGRENRLGSATVALCPEGCATPAHVYVDCITAVPYHIAGATPAQSCLGSARGGGLPRRLRRHGAGVRWWHHDGALPLNWRHGGVGLAGQCHDGAFPRRSRQGRARARGLHHDGVLPLKWRHVGA